VVRVAYGCSLCCSFSLVSGFIWFVVASYGVCCVYLTWLVLCVSYKCFAIAYVECGFVKCLLLHLVCVVAYACVLGCFIYFRGVI